MLASDLLGLVGRTLCIRPSMRLYGWEAGVLVLVINEPGRTTAILRNGNGWDMPDVRLVYRPTDEVCVA